MILQILSAYGSLLLRAMGQTLLLALIDMLRHTTPDNRDVPKDKLLERAQVSPAILSALVKKGVAEVYTIEINRFRYNGGELTGLPTLSPAQADALDKIHLLWKEKDVNLLHGVTSSGKTESARRSAATRSPRSAGRGPARRRRWRRPG